MLELILRRASQSRCRVVRFVASSSSGCFGVSLSLLVSVCVCVSLCVCVCDFRGGVHNDHALNWGLSSMNLWKLGKLIAARQRIGELLYRSHKKIIAS